VIQAEFALNVVQHIHRVGRASRAGKPGFATNFFDERNNDLVKSLLADQEGETSSFEDSAQGQRKNMDSSFSRRRGFRKKLKKLNKIL
jgi:superfamily II DNA/RNA helicase